MRKKLIPVILAGGVGTRLWPLSRELHPKPFIKLDDGKSLIQKTYLRAASIGNIEEIVTVTNRALFFYTKDEYSDIAIKGIYHSFLLEPFGRNSAAAIALAAHYVQKKYGDDHILLVLPADHLIDKQAEFADAVIQAATLAAQGKLVTFGIEPDSPQTGFGYIETNGAEVVRFIEKPKLKAAQRYLSSGNFYWNAGMFCMRVDTTLSEMQSLCPDIAENTLIGLTNAICSQGDGWYQLEIRARHFTHVRDISIDYALFEQAKNVAIVPCDIGWSDIGSWSEFGVLCPRDEAGNHTTGDVVLEDVCNCVIHSGNRLIAGIGLDDLVIADTVDALLIADKGRVQDVRKIVDKLRKKNDPRYQLSPTIYRPWGTYTTLLQGAGFKVKHIEIKPGAALSLQSHKYRSEHWVVISGTAKVTNDDNICELQYSQSTYIPAGNRHRLENPGNEVLTLIEVQCGDYLGEDDIIRYEDIYGRTV